MYKEILIIGIIIILIFALDIITNKYTSIATENLSNDLEELREELREDIIKEKEDVINDKMKAIFDKWHKYHEVLVYYIEHDELEKVETELTTLKGSLEVKEYPHSIGNLDTAIFILEHIKEKEKFSIQSIF